MNKVRTCQHITHLYIIYIKTYSFFFNYNAFSLNSLLCCCFCNESKLIKIVLASIAFSAVALLFRVAKANPWAGMSTIYIHYAYIILYALFLYNILLFSGVSPVTKCVPGTCTLIYIIFKSFFPCIRHCQLTLLRMWRMWCQLL